MPPGGGGAHRVLGPVFEAGVVVALAVPFGAAGIADRRRQASVAAHTAELDRDLGIAVSRVGGGDAVVRRGAPAADRAFAPHLAWLTTMSIGEVERSRGRGLLFAAGSRDPGSLVAQAPPSPAFNGLAQVGRWKVYEPRARGSAGVSEPIRSGAAVSHPVCGALEEC